MRALCAGAVSMLWKYRQTGCFTIAKLIQVKTVMFDLRQVIEDNTAVCIRMGCLKPIQILYVPTVNTPSKKCPHLPYVDTDTNGAKCELNIAVYYYGIMSVNINWK